MSKPPVEARFLIRERLVSGSVIARWKSWSVRCCCLLMILTAWALLESQKAWADASSGSPLDTEVRAVLLNGEKCESCHTSGVPTIKEPPYKGSPGALKKIITKIEKPTTREGVLKNLLIIYENKLLREESFFQPENLALFLGGDQSDWAWANNTTWLTSTQRAFAHCGTDVACRPSGDWWWFRESGDTWTGGGKTNGNGVEIHRIRRVGDVNYSSLVFEYQEDSGISFEDAKNMFFSHSTDVAHISGFAELGNKQTAAALGVYGRGWLLKVEAKIEIGFSSIGNVKAIRFLDVY